MAKQRTLKTASGMSVNELALQLKRQNPNIKLKDHLAKANQMIKAQDTIKYGGGSKLRYKLIRASLGKKAANYITDDLADKGKMDEAHGHLKDYEDSMEMAEKQHMTGTGSTSDQRVLKVIMGKLDKIEKAVMAIKTPRAAEAQTLSSAPMAQKVDEQADKDLAAGIKTQFPNYKKDDITALMASVAHLNTVEEKMLAILKAGGKAEKIPKPRVAAEVKQAQVTIAAQPAHVPAPMGPTPGTTEPRPEQAQTPTPTAMAAPMTAPPIAPQKLQANDAKTDSDQEEAKQVKALQDQERARKAQEEREEAMKKELDKILDTLKDNNLADLLTKALAWMGGKLLGLVGKGLWKLVKGAGKMLWDLAKDVWKGIKRIGSSIKDLFKSGEKAAAGAGEKALAKGGEKTLEKEGEKIGAEEAAKIGGKTIFKSFLKKLPGIGALAGLGFAAADLLEGDVSGAALDAASGIVSIVPGFGTAASFAIDAAHAAKDAGAFSSSEAVKDVPKSATADKSVASDDPPDESGDDDDSPAPVVVQQDNRRTVIQNGGGEVTPVIKVRNDEPTASGITAAIFDHPASYGAVYRM